MTDLLKRTARCEACCIRPPLAALPSLHMCGPCVVAVIRENDNNMREAEIRDARWQARRTHA